MEEIISQIYSSFKKHFNDGEPLLIRSPGRVNLIGEHTDYNEGFVLPAAIDKAIYFALSPREDKRCCIIASDLEETVEFNVNALEKNKKQWPNYLMGVLDQFAKAGFSVPGFNCVFGGNIPIAAGLSSSAALEAGLAFGLNQMFELGIDKLSLVKIAQRAENEFVGVQCGIMDQLINIFGQQNQVLKLDCRTLEFQYYPFERDDLRIVLCDTQVSRELSSSEYNQRRKQCEAGVQFLQQYFPEIKSLRDVNTGMLDEYGTEMNPVIYRRCKYVVEENERVLKACEDLQENDFFSFGKRMYESHRGLRDEYEVSCRELDLLVEAASRTDGVLGARMMGAGFGGCTINLVQQQKLDYFLDAIGAVYRNRLHRDARIYVTRIEPGTEILKEKLINI